MQPTQIQETEHLIVGAGAAGCAVAQCLSASRLAHRSVWLEQHSEPGGSAGYFARGQPKRRFDAGATQLIECRAGQLQHTLHSLVQETELPADNETFEQIQSITQHWPARHLGIKLTTSGTAQWLAPQPPTAQELSELQSLERFLRRCEHDADWMWGLMQNIPRFPLQSFSDIFRALALFLKIPLAKKLALPFLLFRTARSVMNEEGVNRSGLANDIISGLLIDTTQSSPERSPWLAAAMGASILQRGIFRCRGGMRTYFRPVISSYERQQGIYRPNELVVRIETHHNGFLVTSVNTRTNVQSQYLSTQTLILNLTVWDLLSDIVPQNDPIRKTRVYQVWKKRSQREVGWGAFALYALVPDAPAWDDEPQYHQIFPLSDESDLTASSLYVSIPARSDSANPQGFRVLTATIHMDAQVAFSSEKKSQVTECLKRRIEAALKTELINVESAAPHTYARYTRRMRGQVGGFQLTLKNFLFFALPSQLKHPSKRGAQLLLCGDTVFPGQGIIACSVSGIIAFERACRRSFKSLCAGVRKKSEPS